MEGRLRKGLEKMVLRVLLRVEAFIHSDPPFPSPPSFLPLPFIGAAAVTAIFSAALGPFVSILSVLGFALWRAHYRGTPLAIPLLLPSSLRAPSPASFIYSLPTAPPNYRVDLSSSSALCMRLSVGRVWVSCPSLPQPLDPCFPSSNLAHQGRSEPLTASWAGGLRTSLSTCSAPHVPWHRRHARRMPTEGLPKNFAPGRTW